MRIRRTIYSTAQRSGMTLLEVILALAIFLFSLVAISQLFTTATNQAEEIAFQSRATRLAQSKLGEYIAGVLSLSSNPGSTFDEEPEWEWSSDIQADGTAAELYLVTVHVSRNSNRGRIETSLSQYVFNPRAKGNISPPPTASSTDTTAATTNSSATGTTSSSTGATGGTTTQPSGGSTNTGATGGTKTSGGGGGTSSGGNSSGGTGKSGGR